MGEVAHIVAAQPKGPRGNSASEERELTSFNNLVLLCLNCHTIVDRAPQEYPVNVLSEWKESHSLRISEALGVIRYSRRNQARPTMAQILNENRRVWQTYGPESRDSWKPEAAAIWFQNMRDVILPNNARIQKIIDANLHLLTEEERDLASDFSAHARSLEQRHLGGMVDPFGLRFPQGFDRIFSDQ
ncbi:hypothetical protein [Streptacidiphilus sp. P02-A3a]|uniref:hypothetical protein n=1 Tax=Streptacidiphilus sp. P02-A3a TaxID=2704468 RepID=UPI0015FAFF56|nr:hypothetical protein [Streptacidiphilus sp. P02-A3a]QMU69084.1 hypothetical protein GXP74_13355 [Streptacidiphilus sp. P02-A3a]